MLVAKTVSDEDDEDQNNEKRVTLVNVNDISMRRSIAISALLS